MVLLTVALFSCGLGTPGPPEQSDLAARRESMVATQIEARGIHDALTLKAMREVPRHRFVPPEAVGAAYGDYPLPIGHRQTISQPYIVAFMTEALRLRAGDKVLEVGTGSGYQAAVLAAMGMKVFTIEIVEPLATESRERLSSLGYSDVFVRSGDGYAGWPEEAPFDGILVTAAAPRVPEPLKAQLKEGGRLVIPVGEDFQELVVVRRREASYEEKRVLAVRFVPMTGKVRQ
jgi:protein-L-isoaspartate(D-aspartate) O-methyltransferase